MTKEKEIISPWVSSIISFLVGIVFAIIGYLSTKALWPSILLLIAGDIFAEFVIFKFWDYQKMRETINRLLCRDPLFLENIDSMIFKMEKTKEKFGTVIMFARESVQEMINNHFVIVFRGPEEYRNNIERLTLLSQSSIEGTCTLRPKLFVEPIDIAGDIERKDEKERRLQYLKLILSAKAPNKCRIIILARDEIKDIIKECCEAIEEIVDDGGGDQFYDIPEVQWFVSLANGNKYVDTGKPQDIKKQKIRLFWSEHTHAIEAGSVNCLPKDEYKIDNHTIEEFALFDRQVVVKYLKENNWSKGILFMAWTGIQTVEDKYNATFSSLETNPNIANDNIYTSFYDLVTALWSKSPDKMDINGPLNGVLGNCCSATQVYKEILDLLEKKRLKFKKEYKDMWVNL